VGRSTRGRAVNRGIYPKCGRRIDPGFWVNWTYPFAATRSDPPCSTKYLNQRIVVDLNSPFVCLGKLTRFDDLFLELKERRPARPARHRHDAGENYVAESVATGVKRNRKRVLVRRAEVVAISMLEDVVDE